MSHGPNFESMDWVIDISSPHTYRSWVPVASLGNTTPLRVLTSCFVSKELDDGLDEAFSR